MNSGSCCQTSSSCNCPIEVNYKEALVCCVVVVVKASLGLRKF